jgi:hypothetical protein
MVREIYPKKEKINNTVFGFSAHYLITNFNWSFSTVNCSFYLT